jgi:hypothetical protein
VLHGRPWCFSVAQASSLVPRKNTRNFSIDARLNAVIPQLVGKHNSESRGCARHHPVMGGDGATTIIDRDCVVLPFARGSSIPRSRACPALGEPRPAANRVGRASKSRPGSCPGFLETSRPTRLLRIDCRARLQRISCRTDKELRRNQPQMHCRAAARGVQCNASATSRRPHGPLQSRSTRSGSFCVARTPFRRIRNSRR